VEHKERYEQALAENEKGLALFAAIQKGDEPYEKMAEAEAHIAEAGKLMDQANLVKKAAEQAAFLTEGIGSLTAAPPEGNGDTPPESKWGSLSEFGVAVAAMGDPALRAEVEAKGLLSDDWQTKLLQEAVGAAGGFLVPIEYKPELFQKAYEASIVRPRATVLPMTVTQLQMPSLDQTILPAAPLSAFFGGLRFFWTEEGAPKTLTDMDFKLIDLIVHEYSGYLPVTNRLIADSAISLETLIRTQFGKCAAGYEDWHYLNGNGVGQPQGVISAGATIQPTRDTANCIDWDDIKRMLHAFQPGANGVWVAHICTMEQLMAMQDATGHNMWVPNMRDGIPEKLMGYPLIFTEKVPNLGTKGDINLCDFSYYLIGDREQPTIDSSIHYKFVENQTVFRLSARVDGKPWLTAPIRLMPDGTTSISPFVSLSEDITPT